MIRILAALCCIMAFAPFHALAGDATMDQDIHSMITSFKTDPRGPYQAIRWYCPDGTMLPGDQRCSEPGGIQHALVKDSVRRLAESRHVFLGQILAGTGNEDFFDEPNHQSRMKQYMLEIYLRAADDGWILRKARFYRGAVQAEDEEWWGRNYLTWLMGNGRFPESSFYLARQAVKVIPHDSGAALWPKVRELARTMADAYPPFNDLRVKLHGHADRDDAKRVRSFLDSHIKDLDEIMQLQGIELIQYLDTIYGPVNTDAIKACAAKLPRKHAFRARIDSWASFMAESPGPRESCAETARLLVQIRNEVLNNKSPAQRLALMDLSVLMEDVFFREASAFVPATLRDLLDKLSASAMAAEGCGLFEQWEWAEVEKTLAADGAMASLPIETLMAMSDTASRMAAWGAGTVRAVFGDVVREYTGFEPLAQGFIDDRIRSCPLLVLGETAGRLSEVLSAYAPAKNQVMGLAAQSGVRGLNPGYAAGELVVSETLQGSDAERDKIYVLLKAPADLKPVAGMITVSEGNAVSHVQLLARNLGIPNAVAGEEVFNSLKAFSGQPVFYAVSPGGAVRLKAAGTITSVEKDLIAVQVRREEKVTVSVKNIDLARKGPISLANVWAADSGKVCGPKAANLGQLKAWFPDHVVNGIVLPFGAFREHMNRPMPGENGSLWDYLRETFSGNARTGEDTMDRLGRLQSAILSLPPEPELLAEIERAFDAEFGASMDDVPVFVRSDTNMEDLKDFTGAGLNLTVFNVRGKDKIVRAIQDVWASVYSPRSYLWRQKYLTNPENVFPSILIIPTVNVEKSGVVITSGLGHGGDGAITVAFSRGAGGAVEGQAAESYLILADGTNRLLSPSREPEYKILPDTGGVERGYTTFEQRILTGDELARIRELAGTIGDRFRSMDPVKGKGPYDIEMGFLKGGIWLFQVRPFVENKRAKGSGYLLSLDPPSPENVRVPLIKPL